MTQEELDTFLRIQPSYMRHLQNDKNSLLVKIFGVFTLKCRGMGSVHVMLMENTLQTKNKKNLMFTFDLKGSKHGRITKGLIKPSTIQKDQNLMK